MKTTKKINKTIENNLTDNLSPKQKAFAKEMHDFFQSLIDAACLDDEDFDED